MRMKCYPIKMIIDETLKTWKRQKSIITVPIEPKVPGAKLILPKPNIVTNKELNILIIFNY